MPVSIDQKPLYDFLPIGQQIIFAVSENDIVANKFKVKFIAQVHVSNEAINLSSVDDVIGTFKTTPNNAGVGIFDLRPILETFVSPDYEPNSTTFPTSVSEYKGVAASRAMFPIHLIDDYSVSDKAIRFFAIQFKIEFAETDDSTVLAPGDTDPITGTSNTNNAVNTEPYTFFNGVLQYDDALRLDNGNYGYNLDYSLNPRHFFLYYNPVSIDQTANFLSNAPTTQYARDTDYGTFALLNFQPNTGHRVKYIKVVGYNPAGFAVISDAKVNAPDNGGTWNFKTKSYNYLQYVGIFPANLRAALPAWETAFAAGNIIYYTIQAFGLPDAITGEEREVSELYTINIICPNERGYEGIRLTWLNQWGTWDYYTFNMKSTRSVTTKRIPYTQQGGTWNESTFKIKGWKGGKKNFRVNSTEKIKLNTDFVTEAEGVWFEELINSPEVYIVNDYDGTELTPYDTITNKYVEPVVLTTSSYVRKTIANDKLMQYTFEIEKSKMQRTQAV
jgi:hypothetical protein